MLLRATPPYSISTSIAPSIEIKYDIRYVDSDKSQVPHRMPATYRNTTHKMFAMHYHVFTANLAVFCLDLLIFCNYYNYL